MNCKEFLDNLYELENPNDISQSMAHHMNECDHCREEFNQLANMIGMLSNLSDYSMPEELEGKIRREIMKGEGDKKVSFFRRHRNWIAIAAALVLIVSLPFIGGRYLFMKSSNDSVAVEGMDYGGNFREEATEEMAPAMPEEESYTVSTTDGDELKDTTQPAEEPAAEQSYDEKLVRNGYLYLETMEFDFTIDEATRLTKQYLGYVEYSSISVHDYYYDEVAREDRNLRYGDMSVRIPKESFDEFIGKVKELGEVISSNESVRNITESYYDIDGRIKNLRAREVRLRELLEKAEELEDILSIDRELTQVTYEIESLTRTLKGMDKDVDYSQISISVREVVDRSKISTPTKNFFTEIKEAFVSGVNDVMDGLFGLAVFVVRRIFYIVMFALVIWLVIWRLRKRADRE